jgi:1-acyl-sn-glycerol-3-phosphate acyltransferase
MQRTIFDARTVSTALHHLSRFYLKLSGWRKEGRAPDEPKYVMIAAPHTSNWDLFYTLLLAFAFRIKVFWLGKKAIFRPPFRRLCRWLGGIPIDRSRSNNMVAEAVRIFGNHERMILIVPPEGTRKKVRYWKTGFYYIAHGAGVPIALGYVDYRRKAGGIGPMFHPTGCIEDDMKDIQAFYAGVTGKRPLLTSNESIATKSGENTQETGVRQ